MLISDSIAKYVVVDDVTVRAFPGNTVLQVLDKVRFGEVSVHNQRAVMLLVGTNDIANITTDVTFEDFLCRFKALVDLIKARNSHVILLICSILPRFVILRKLAL